MQAARHRHRWRRCSGSSPTAIVLTWIYNHTHCSVLAVIITHLMDNLAGEMLGFSDDARPIQVLVLVVAAAFVVWHWLRTDANVARRSNR